MLNKTCTKCGEEKPLERFYKHKTCRGGFESVCKDCISKKGIESRRAAGIFPRPSLITETGKICTKCKQEKPLEQFNKCKASKNGLNNYCKVCLNKDWEKYRRAHGAKPQKVLQKTEKGKICMKCGIDKSLEEFGKTKKATDGLNWHCKRCVSERSKEFNSSPFKVKRIMLPETKVCSKCRETKSTSEFSFQSKIHGTLKYFCIECEKAYRKIYHKNHKEKICEKARKFYTINGEQVKERMRIFRKENPEYVRLMEKTRRDNNKDSKRATDQRRRARELGNGGSFTSEEWVLLKKKYNSTCLRCGKREPKIELTVDHVLPLYWGGRNDIRNIQPLCKSCNSSKHINFADYRPDSKTYGEGWKQPSLWGKVS